MCYTNIVNQNKHLKKKGKNMKNTLKKKKDCYYANGKKFDSFKDALAFIFENAKNGEIQK
jgi:uncharacterized protein (UPF0216 family)